MLSKTRFSENSELCVLPTQQLCFTCPGMGQHRCKLCVLLLFKAANNTGSLHVLPRCLQLIKQVGQRNCMHALRRDRDSAYCCVGSPEHSSCVLVPPAQRYFLPEHMCLLDSMQATSCSHHCKIADLQAGIASTHMHVMVPWASSVA